MHVAYCEKYIWVFMLRAEAEGVRRMPDKRNFLVTEDRKYFLINTEHPEHYVQFQKDGAGHNTIKLNDKALDDLLEKGIIRGKDSGIDITFEIDDKFAERLLNKQN
jgi:hypothetical protein